MIGKKRGWLAPLVVAGAAILMFTSVPAGAASSPTNEPIFGTYRGLSELTAPSGLGPYSGTITARVGDGPLAGTTMVITNTVNRNYPNLIDPNEVNTVVISDPGGALMGVTTSYSFATDPGCFGVGCTGTGAVRTIRITGGTGRFQSVTGGDLTMNESTTWLDISQFPNYFAQSTFGTITGSLQR
jgi:hypothetical protein